MADPSPARTASLALAGVCALLLATWVVTLVPVVRTTGLRTAVVLPATILCPGYALLAAVSPRPDPTSLLDDALVRTVLALAVGLATATLLAIGLAASPWPVTTPTTIVALTATTLSGLALAAARGRVPRRPAVGSRSVGSSLAAARGRGERGTPWGLTRGSPEVLTVGVLVLVAGVAGVAGTGYLAGVHQSPGHVEFGLEPASGTWNGSEGTASAYELHVRDADSGNDRSAYTIVALRQEVDPETLAVQSSATLGRFDVSLDEAGTWRRTHDPDLAAATNDTRLVYHLYRGEGTTGRPDAQVHRWIGADGSDGGEAT